MNRRLNQMKKYNSPQTYRNVDQGKLDYLSVRQGAQQSSQLSYTVRQNESIGSLENQDSVTRQAGD